jgi:hypothetical protein
MRYIFAFTAGFLLATVIHSGVLRIPLPWWLEKPEPIGILVESECNMSILKLSELAVPALAVSQVACSADPRIYGCDDIMRLTGLPPSKWGRVIASVKYGGGYGR